MGGNVRSTFKRSWSAISESCTLVTVAGFILWLCGVPIPDIPVAGAWLVPVVESHPWVLWAVGLFMGAALHRSITAPRGRRIGAALSSWTKMARMALSPRCLARKGRVWARGDEDRVDFCRLPLRAETGGSLLLFRACQPLVGSPAVLGASIRRVCPGASFTNFLLRRPRSRAARPRDAVRRRLHRGGVACGLHVNEREVVSGDRSPEPTLIVTDPR